THLLGSEVMGSMSPYGVGGGHRHTPEMIQNLSAAAGTRVSVSFTPTLAPMPRGILATCSAKAVPGTTAESVRAAYEKAYADEPFVHLLPEG
ncbi:Asd/ArgC dimerization domain-containing protein, partial [Streptomyces bambusae]